MEISVMLFAHIEQKRNKKKKKQRKERGVADLPITGPQCKKEMDAYITKLYIWKKK